MFRVSVLGHSNVPREPLEVYGCEVRTYRSPGAHAATFDENPTFRPVLEWQHELSVLFIGSNDVTPNTEVFEVTEAIKHAVTKLEGCADTMRANIKEA